MNPQPRPRGSKERGKKMAKVSVYTRKSEKESYPFGLASAVHFEIVLEDKITALNNNYGILFAQGEISEKNTIIPLGISNPVIFKMDEKTIVVAGKRVLENKEAFESDKNMAWVWKTEDLKHFETVGLMDKKEIDKFAPGKTLEVDDNLAKSAQNYWNPIEANNVKKTEKYKFPLSKEYGDPVIFSWEGKWYFISTNDNLNDIGIYVRESDNVAGLFDENVIEHLILPYDEKRNLIQTFWAPEFHLIGGELYILFAVSGKQWGPQCHMMKLKKGGRITDPDSWSDPIRVVKKDGSPLAEGPITLDMTYIKCESGSYVAWSYREHICDPLDTGSMIYIASIDEDKPWQLTSDPVLLTRPLLGWENLEGTINNEGPYAFIRDGKVNLSYSGGAANGYTYAVGLLTADTSANLLDQASWSKSITPILSFYSVDEFGPGHNSFFVDEDGELMIAYHGEMEITDHLRCDMIRKVYFKEDGIPYFA